MRMMKKNKTGRKGRDWTVWVDFSADVTWVRGVNDKASATQKSTRRVWQITEAAGIKSQGREARLVLKSVGCEEDQQGRAL